MNYIREWRYAMFKLEARVLIPSVRSMNYIIRRYNRQRLWFVLCFNPFSQVNELHYFYFGGVEDKLYCFNPFSQVNELHKQKRPQKNSQHYSSFNPFSQVNELHRILGYPGWNEMLKRVLIPSVRSMNYMRSYKEMSDEREYDVLIPSVRSMNYMLSVKYGKRRRHGF